MSADYPSFLGGNSPTYNIRPRPVGPKVEIPRSIPSDVSWLVSPKEPPSSPSDERKSLAFVQFEVVLPRILERICAGVTVNNAVKELAPLVKIDLGAFLHWLKKNPSYYALYKVAQEVRTEVWSGKMIEHATGIKEDGEDSLNDVSRDKLAVDTYWKLMGAQNRKEYGDTKIVQVEGSISITAALAQGRSRVIEAQLVQDDVDLMSARQIRQLEAADDSEYDD